MRYMATQNTHLLTPLPGILRTHRAVEHDLHCGAANAVNPTAFEQPRLRTVADHGPVLAQPALALHLNVQGRTPTHPAAAVQVEPTQPRGLWVVQYDQRRACRPQP